MPKGKPLIKGFMLLSLTAVIVIIIRQATTPNTLHSRTVPRPRQTENSWLMEKLEWFRTRQSSVANSSAPINPKTLSPGTHLVIKLSDRRVYIYQNQALKQSYPVAIGKAGWETPTGNYKVMDKEPNPVWEHPWTGEVILEGPKNPLGARWIGFWTDGVNSIGFHGTPAEELVGQAVSHGCVRMRNQDIIALYEHVKVGTPVTVQP
jgi:lipoprotein-anchoring transpeptidase ErfK/SrfK